MDSIRRRAIAGIAAPRVIIPISAKRGVTMLFAEIAEEIHNGRLVPLCADLDTVVDTTMLRLNKWRFGFSEVKEYRDPLRTELDILRTRKVLCRVKGRYLTDGEILQSFLDIENEMKSHYKPYGEITVKVGDTLVATERVIDINTAARQFWELAEKHNDTNVTISYSMFTHMRWDILFTLGTNHYGRCISYIDHRWAIIRAMHHAMPIKAMCDLPSYEFVELPTEEYCSALNKAFEKYY